MAVTRQQSFMQRRIADAMHELDRDISSASRGFVPVSIANGHAYERAGDRIGFALSTGKVTASPTEEEREFSRSLIDPQEAHEALAEMGRIYKQAWVWKKLAEDAGGAGRVARRAVWYFDRYGYRPGAGEDARVETHLREEAMRHELRMAHEESQKAGVKSAVG